MHSPTSRRRCSKATWSRRSARRKPRVRPRSTSTIASYRSSAGLTRSRRTSFPRRSLGFEASIMNFQHTEDRRMLADTLDRFIGDRYDFAVRSRIAQSALGFEPELWRGFAALGAVGALFPEADGGYGGAGFDIAVVFECLGRGLVVEPFLGALLVGRALCRAGSVAQRGRLGEIIDGSTVAAFAHSEPGTHYELAQVATRAESSGEGWLLHGSKSVVQLGGQADLFLVSARTSGAADDADGISLFLVPGKVDGLTRRDYPRIDGGRAAELVLDKVWVGADALVGEAGQGLSLLEHVVGVASFEPRQSIFADRQR